MPVTTDNSVTFRFPIRWGQIVLNLGAAAVVGAIAAVLLFGDTSEQRSAGVVIVAMLAIPLGLCLWLLRGPSSVTVNISGLTFGFIGRRSRHWPRADIDHIRLRNLAIGSSRWLRMHGLYLDVERVVAGRPSTISARVSRMESFPDLVAALVAADLPFSRQRRQIESSYDRRVAGRTAYWVQDDWLTEPTATEVVSLGDVHQALVTSFTYKRERRETWMRPTAFEARAMGDCEEFALWAWNQLHRLGYEPEFFVGLSTKGVWHEAMNRRGHAWTEAVIDGRTCTFDTAGMQIKSARWPWQPQASRDSHNRVFVYG